MMNKIIKYIFGIVFFCVVGVSQAQFYPVSYDFTPDAQVLQTNPGAVYPYKYYVGIPVLGGTSVFAGNSGFSMADLFGTQNTFQQKVINTLNTLNNTDHVLVNYRQDVLSAGFKTESGVLHHFGLYEEIDHITYIPADLIRLGFEGNASHLNDVYDARILATKTEFIQTLYYGINKRISNKLQLGFRFKLYSGIANVQSVYNSGKFYTTEGVHNYYAHHLDDIDISLNTSGFNEDADSAGYYTNKLLYSGNYGPGLDFGLTYKSNENLTWTASLLDLGFIYYTKDIHNFHLKGNYTFEGANMQFPENNFIDYWKDIKEDFKGEIKNTKSTDAYMSYRPVTLYTSLKYSAGSLKKQNCDNFLHPKTSFSDFFGLIGYAQYRPLKIHLGASAYYEKKWSKYISTRLNYTVDNYSYSGIGAGMVANLGAFQVYLMTDNIIGLTDLAKTKKLSFQLGLNIIKFAD